MLPVAGLAAMLPAIVRRVGDPDAWWHLRTGRWMLDNHAIVRSDLYTYTVPGAPWTDHEYLSQILFYGLDKVGGLLALSVFFGAVVWAGFWFIYLRIRQHLHAPLIAGIGLFIGAIAGIAVWGPRPQMFDFFFSAVTLYLIERYLIGKSRALWFLPLIVVAWANLHGGFVFAFFFLAISALAVAIQWLLSRARHLLMTLRTFAVVGVLSVVASLMTPNGPSLFLYVWRTQFSSQQSSFIAEWQSPDFHMLNMLGFEAMLLLVLIGFAWRRPRLLDVLLVVASGVLALRAWRFIPLFVVPATPLLVWQWSEPWARLRGWLKARPIGQPREWIGEGVAMLLGLAIVAGIGLSAYTLRGQAASTQANYPVAAADWLTAHPNVGTRMFNEYSWGGYLSYRFYPDPNRRVFIYGEAELVGDQLLAQYVEVNQLHSDWMQVLDQWGVDYVLFPADKPLDAALAAAPGWHLAYSDSVADIFVRR